jgi:uncharacterized pyridoxal phosphate-containing UPF0001 family protein
MGRGGVNVSIDSLRTNLAAVERQIEDACVRAGRQNSPRLLVASKYFDVDEMRVLAQAGIGLVGENRAEGLETRSSSTSSAICRAARSGRYCLTSR